MRWIVVITLCAAAGAASWALHPDPPPEDDSRSVKPSKSHAAESLIFAGGIVEGAAPEIVVRAEVPGRIKAAFVKEGSRVEAGQVLAILDSELAELRLREARAVLVIAQAERRRLGAPRQSAQKDKNPRSNVKFSAVPRSEAEPAGAIRPVGDRGPVSPAAGPRAEQRSTAVAIESELPGASLTGEIHPQPQTASPEDLEIADARINQAEAAVRREVLHVEKHSLRSPMDGIAVRVDARPGEFVDPADPRERWVIVDPSRTRVRAFVEELDAMKVTSGQTALVGAVGRPHQQEVGRVVECAATLRPKTHRHLKPGERIDVRVREVVIELNGNTELLIGLPVEVFIQRKGQ